MVASLQHAELSQHGSLDRRLAATREPSHDRFPNVYFFRQTLPREALMATAAEGPVDEACALADRGDLDDKLIEVLARRPEGKVVYTLAYNAQAGLGRKILRVLMERGREDARLARALLRREDLHLCHFRLFMHATEEERAHLIAIARLSHLDTIRGAEAYPEPDADRVARVEHAALDGDRAAFEQALATAFSCDLSMAERIARDKGGEALALAFAALGLDYESAVRIFLSGLPDRDPSIQKIRALMRIIYSVPRLTAARLVRTIVDLADAECGRKTAPPAAA